MNLNRNRFRYTLSFGHSESVERPNGTYGTQFVEDFTRKAALYTITDKVAQSLTGIDTTKDLVFAVNKQYQDALNPFLDTSDLAVSVSSDPDNDYSITQISFADDSAVIGYHLIAIRKVQSND